MGRTFPLLLAAFFALILLLFAVGVRYGHTDQEESLGGPQGEARLASPLFR